MAKRASRAAEPKPTTTEVVGVVHPLGSGGGRGGKETLWTLRFSFSVWRRKGGAVDERQLRVARPGLTDKALRAMMDRVNPYDILRVRVRLTEPAAGAPDAELVTLHGPVTSDAELTARADQLRQPVTVDHPYFGTLTLDRALNWYAVTAPWNGRPVQLFLARNGCDDEEELFAAAQALWERQKSWDRRVRVFAAAEMLDLKNGLWLGDDETAFTRTRFKAKMTPESVSVSAGGRFEFTFDDGNLFWGHVIQVSGTLAEGPEHAGIAG